MANLLDDINNWITPSYKMYKLRKSINNAILKYGVDKVRNSLETSTPSNYNIFYKSNNIIDNL